MKQNKELELDQAAAGAAAAQRKKKGWYRVADLGFKSGRKTSLLDVADFTWNKSGSVLAYAVSVKETEKMQK